MAKKEKYRIELDKVYPKKKEQYTNFIDDAKYKAKMLLFQNPQGIARIKELKADGKAYKSKSSHWWAKNRETGKDRIVGL